MRLVFGETWQPIVPLVQWLSLPATVLPFYNSMSWLFIARARHRELFWLSLATTPIVVLGFILGVSHGPLGVCIAAAMMFTVPLPLATLYLAHSSAGISLGQTLAPAAKIVSACAVAALCVMFAARFAGPYCSDWRVILAMKAAIGGGIYVIVIHRLGLTRDLPWRTDSSHRTPEAHLHRSAKESPDRGTCRFSFDR